MDDKKTLKVETYYEVFDIYYKDLAVAEAILKDWEHKERMKKIFVVNTDGESLPQFNNSDLSIVCGYTIVQLDNSIVGAEEGYRICYGKECYTAISEGYLVEHTGEVYCENCVKKQPFEVDGESVFYTQFFD